MLKSRWSLGKGSPPEICKDPSGEQHRRAREHEWPRARRAVALLAAGSLAGSLAGSPTVRDRASLGGP